MRLSFTLYSPWVEMAPPPRCNRGTTRSFLNSAVFSQLESRQIDGVCKDENDQQRRDEERRGYMLFAHHRSPLSRSLFSGFVREFQRLSPPVSINFRGTQSSSSHPACRAGRADPKAALSIPRRGRTSPTAPSVKIGIGAGFQIPSVSTFTAKLARQVPLQTHFARGSSPLF